MRPRVIGALALGALLTTGGASAGPVAQQDGAEELLVRRHDLRTVLAAGAPIPNDVPAALHQSSAWMDTLEPDSYDPGLGPAAGVGPFEIINLLGIAAEASGDAEDVRFEWRGGWLQVEGPGTAQETVADAVELLLAAARESVEIEVIRLDDDRIPAGTPALLDAQQAAALLEDVGDALVCRQSVPLGRNMRVGDGALVTYLCDEDREGRFTLGLDPGVSVVRAGLELGVRAERAVDGERFVVRVWGRDGGPSAEIERTRTEGRVPRTIELLTVPTSSFCASGIVPVGGALLLDHDGGNKGAVIVRLRSAVPGQRAEGLTPLGALALPPLRVGPPYQPEAAPSGGLWFPDYEYFDGWYGDRGTMADAYDGRRTASGFSLLPPRYGSTVLSGFPGFQNEATREALDELRSTVQVRTIALDARYDLVDPAELEATLGVEGIEQFAARASGRLEGAAIDGETLLLVGGRERGYLMDLDAQISMGGASPPDPIVSSIYEGVALWFSPFVRPGGDVAGWFRFSRRESPGKFREIQTFEWVPEGRPVAPISGSYARSHSLQLPRVQRADIRTFVDAPSGEWTLVGARPLTGSGKTLVVVARMVVL